MDKIYYFTGLFVGHITGFAMKHSVALLIFFGIVGFIIYLVGDAYRKKGLTLTAQNVATEFPYKSVALSLNLLGVVILFVVAVLLYFAGAYDPFFAKLGW